MTKLVLIGFGLAYLFVGALVLYPLVAARLREKHQEDGLDRQPERERSS